MTKVGVYVYGIASAAAGIMDFIWNGGVDRVGESSTRLSTVGSRRRSPGEGRKSRN